MTLAAFAPLEKHQFWGSDSGDCDVLLHRCLRCWPCYNLAIQQVQRAHPINRSIEKSLNLQVSGHRSQLRRCHAFAALCSLGGFGGRFSWPIRDLGMENVYCWLKSLNACHTEVFKIQKFEFCHGNKLHMVGWTTRKHLKFSKLQIKNIC